MSSVAFASGYELALQNWLGGGWNWMLVTTGWDPDPTLSPAAYVDSASGFEITAPEYSRLPVTTLAVSATLAIGLDGSGGSVNYTCDNPTFGILSGGDTVGWLVLWLLVTNDADSPLVAALPCGYVCNGLDEAAFMIPATGVVNISTYCSGSVL